MIRKISAAVVMFGLLAACDRTNIPEDREAPIANPPAVEESDESPAAAETKQSVEVIPLEHGSLILRAGGLVIAVDPVTSALENAAGEEPKADLILITHQHGDHLDPAAIAMLRKDGADVVTSQRVVDEAGDKVPAPVVLANGETLAFLAGRVVVEALPMYNLVRKRDNGEFYHPKGMGNGYVVTVEGQRIYLSGDTECTPEMGALKDIDMAFVCMNLPFTMVPEEAAACVREFKPKVLYPYHYRGQDPSKLTSLLADVPEVEVRLLNWYPAGQ